jgi:two-component system, cell cycle response regulator CpdR
MARILLSDDEPAMRELVRRALVQDGHLVTMTQNGSEALDALTAHPHDFDLLISDVQMPGLDGIALASKAVGLCPSLRFIMMSGFVEQLERAKAINALRMVVVTKPFTLEKMRSLVKEVLA